ncbi:MULTISPECIES: glycosyltransferase [Terrisporobacter]|uniref:Glycosyltransferase family 2 protein n=1 Tax=Terrisporobacter muris TaxID=2963284 RepID=A0A9X2MDB1_9FIRM|nr:MULTISPECIES: glycosyltransferase [Terrisporobacter]MCR1823722.1 glycosyltransferase family 2 protein [Terrisporobacter muris]MDY3372512.1 glycosyltransferase [Terrisporobacter othiniensis]
MQTLSLCMITKNEEKNIKACLDSMVNIADEIIIVDTGSTDRTIEIAKSYGAKVFSYKWNDDFSEARNISLEKATKDWIIVLDGDEVLPKEDGKKLKNIINATSMEALYLRLENIVDNKSLGDAVVLRVFRNNKLYRFRNKMHEQVIFSIEENGGKDKIQATNLKILHYGYDPKIYNMVDKQKRNLKILESYPEEDRDGYFYYSIGNEYSRANDINKSLEMYYKGLGFARNNYPDKLPSYLPYLILNISKSLASQKKYDEAINILSEFKNKYPNFRDLYFLQCLYYIEIGKTTKAKDALLEYLNCEYSMYMYPDNNFEDSYNMGTILRQLRKASIPTPEYLLSVLIVGGSYDDTLLLSIKSINEISSEVIVSIPNSSIIDKDIINNFGAKTININSNDGKDMIFKGIKECRGEYILILKEREIIEHDTQSALINFLRTTEENFFNLIIKDNNAKTKLGEFRLLRNDEKVRNTKNFEELIKLVNKEKTKTYDVNILKI